MSYYRFQFLDNAGQLLSEQKLRSNDDGDALEFARLLNHPFAVRILEKEREVGIIRRQHLLSGSRP